MTRRTFALVVTAVAAVTLVGPAQADEPQDVCAGFKDNQIYCFGSDEGLIDLPPIGTGIIRYIRG